MSMTPAFSPGPWITQGALVGSVRRWIFEDLYEQCSFHIAEKMPSSVKVGVRPISLRSRSYSSGLRPCAATSAGVTLGCWSPLLRAGGRLAGAFLLATQATCGGFLISFLVFFGAALLTLVLVTVFFARGLDVMDPRCHCRRSRTILRNNLPQHPRAAARPAYDATKNAQLLGVTRPA